jgi:hypothetical protein
MKVISNNKQSDESMLSKAEKKLLLEFFDLLFDWQVADDRKNEQLNLRVNNDE